MKTTFKVTALLLVLIMLVVFNLGCTAEEVVEQEQEEEVVVEKEKIVLTVSSSWPQTALLVSGLPYFTDFVTEFSEGYIELEYIGGPEAIPEAQHGDAVRNGIVDIAFTTGGYYFDSCPAATFITGYTNQTYPELRANGGHDWFNQVHIEQMNSVVLGSNVEGLKFGVFTRDRINSIEDFKGLRIRAVPVYLPWLTAAGAEPISLPSSEIYSALERGVVDGFGWNSAGMSDWSLHELVNYAIYPQHMNVINLIIMNYDKWQSLPDWAKEALTAAAIELEKTMPSVIGEFVKAEEETMKAAGVELIEIDDPNGFLKFIDQANIEFVRQNYPNGDEIIENLWKPIE